MPGRTPTPALVLAAYGALCVLGLAVALRALPVWPSILFVGALSAGAMALRFGWEWALLGVGIVATTGLYIVATVSAALGGQFHLTMAIVVTAVGLLVVWEIDRHGIASAPRGSALWTTAAPGIWLVAAAVGGVVPGGSRWDWALRGDSSNNVLFARDIITAHGTPFAGANPVPLPHLAVALGMVGEDTPSVASDIASYVGVWHVMIVAALAAAGLIGRRIALLLGVRSAAGVAIATVLPSACVLSWAVTGYALQFGFINAHLGVLLVLLSLAVGLSAPHPGAGIVLQVMVAIDLLVTWSPLAAIPLVMAAIHLVTAFRRRASARAWCVMAAAGALGLAYAVATVIVEGGAARTAFSAQGGVLAPSLRTVAAVLLTMLVSGGLVARRSRRVGAWVMTVAIALSVAIAGTLALAGGHWSYYPMKMAWFAAVVAGIVLAALAGPGLAVVAPRWARIAPAFGLVAGVAVVLGPPALSHATSRALWIAEPLTQLVAPSDGGGDRLFELVDALDTGSDGVALLWDSGAAQEHDVNFWILNEASARFAPGQGADERLAVRKLAYAQLSAVDAQLCGVESLVGAPVVVYTADPSLEGRVRAACGRDAPTIQSLTAAGAVLNARVLANQ